MNKLYKKIYKAINEGIQKALLIDPDQNDVSINYSYYKINNSVDPLLFDFVDLSLTSGTKWCKHNIGATCENIVSSWIGNYYTLLSKSNTYVKYPKTIILNNLNSLNKVIQKEYSKIKNSEIAKLACIPSKEQMEELIEETDNQYVNDYNDITGLNGMIFIGKNGNSIFIPMSGSYNGSELSANNKEGYLWSNTLYNPIKAWSLNIETDRIFVGIDERCYGFPVRPVYKNN